MKKRILLCLVLCTGATAFAQMQIENGDMELWESVSSGEEPVNWNSFMTASGGLSGFADVQVEQSANVRPGSSGTKSAYIWSRDAGFNIVANGNLTLGQVNMGNVVASDPDNHNVTRTADDYFNQPIASLPDSIVFWANYILGGVTPGQARMKATVHDDWDYKDPEGVDDAAHVVGTASLDFPPTVGWQRYAVAFDPVGPATVPAYILVTFATNNTPGGGNVDDKVWIDDVELIYNNVGLDNISDDAFIVSMNNEINTLEITAKSDLVGDYAIFNAMGQEVLTGKLMSEIAFDKTAGVYFVHIRSKGQTYKFEILKN